jgi:hypothetical protein
VDTYVDESLRIVSDDETPKSLWHGAAVAATPKMFSVTD